MAEVPVEWVDEVPDTRREISSKYDSVAKLVRKTGKVARIKCTEKGMPSTAQSLRKRYEDLVVNQRKQEDGFFVYVSKKEGGK